MHKMMRRKHKRRKFKSTWFITLAVLVVAIMTAMYIYSIKDKKIRPYDIVIEDSEFYTELSNPSWHRMDLGPFTIDTPKEYKFIKRQGIDSYVGEFCSPNDTLSFDYGWYSFDPNKEDNNADNEIEYLTIDRRKAKIIYPSNGLGDINLYIDKITELDQLHVGGNSKDLGTKLRILKSVRIKIDYRHYKL